MVSPSKYCSTPNRDYKIGNQRLKKDSVNSQGASKLSRPSTSLEKYQPLLNTKFYLDVRSRLKSTRLESTLRAYGAKVDIFLGKDVSFIITDRTEWIGNGQSPAASISPITTPSPSSQLDQRRAIPKSRASAMLEKVSRQSSSPYSSPLELAQKWKIPVFSIPNFWKWISKIRESVLVKVSEKKRRRRQSLQSEIVVDATDSPFIKIESLFGSEKPELLELEAWPRLHLDGCLRQCPFRSPSPVSSSQSEEYEARSESFEVKDKVTVELIKYDTDFRIKENLDVGECETERSEKAGTLKTAEENVAAVVKVQCNGLTTGHRNSKLLSPSGSDVLPLPTSRRSTRRASASWCGSTRELSQLSPSDGDLENIRRSESSFETHDSSLDSPGITLRPKGQLWLPVALIGTTAEENGNSIRKRYEYSNKQSDGTKFCSFILDSLSSKSRNNSLSNQSLSRASKGSDSSLNSHFSDQISDYQIKRNNEKKETYCVITRNSKVKSDEMNGKSRESSVESLKSAQDVPRSRPNGKKRSLSVGGSATSALKRSRTVSTNSASSVVRKKKLSPEEKLLQDNKEYFKMEVLNTKLRSSGSLLNANQNKNADDDGDGGKSEEKIEKIIIKKIRVKGKRKKNSWTKSSDKKNSDREICTVKGGGGDGKGGNDIKVNGIIRKKRQSELTKLCNEAESFMFGESSRQGTNSNTSADENVSIAAESPPEESGKRKSCGGAPREDIAEESSKLGSSESADGDARKRKKRRSHAEAFIHDNIDYYKFETPGSRLRYQGSVADAKQERDFIYSMKGKKRVRSSNEVNKGGGEGGGKSEGSKEEAEAKTETDVKAERKRTPSQPSEEIEKLLFSFESIPFMEPWYDVYKRQDEGMENYYPLLSDPNDQPFLLPYEMPKTIFSRVPDLSDYYKKKKKKLAQLFNHPRKSPRCHASTLAILSSLKKRKRKSSTNISMNSVLSESPPLGSGSEERNNESKYQESETDTREAFESEDLLSFLHEGEGDEDEEEELVILEPLSKSECDLTCGEGEEEKKGSRTEGGDGQTGSESRGEDEGGMNQFILQRVQPDSFFNDMVIETRKRSCLNISVAAAIENFRNYKTDVTEIDLISEFGGSSIADGPDSRRKKKKPRKINKTGWDNRNSRRRVRNRRRTGAKVSDDGGARSKPKRIKTKVKLKDYGIDEDNIIASSKRRLRNKDEGGRPTLRSRTEVVDRYGSLRRSSREREIHCEGLDSNPVELVPSVVHGKAKVNEARLGPGVKMKCANGRYGLQNRLVLSKQRKVMDYAWATKRR